MSDSQMLQGKRAVIFGAGGSIGAAVASEFAAEGAEVFLAGRTRSNVEAVAQRIGKAGHRAHAAVIDAVDPEGIDALRAYFDRFWTQALDAFKKMAEHTSVKEER